MSKRYELSATTTVTLSAALEAAESASRAWFSGASYLGLYEYWQDKLAEANVELAKVGVGMSALVSNEKPEVHMEIGGEWCRVTLIGSTRRGTRALWVQPQRFIPSSREVWYPAGYRVAIWSEEKEELDRVIVSMT